MSPLRRCRGSALDPPGRARPGPVFPSGGTRRVPGGGADRRGRFAPPPWASVGDMWGLCVLGYVKGSGCIFAGGGHPPKISTGKPAPLTIFCICCRFFVSDRRALIQRYAQKPHAGRVPHGVPFFYGAVFVFFRFSLLTNPAGGGIIAEHKRSEGRSGWYLGVAQLVARYLGVVEAAGSSPVTQTKNARFFSRNARMSSIFYAHFCVFWRKRRRLKTPCQ